MSIKKKFEKFTSKEKIQIYGIVLMCYVLVFVFYEDIKYSLFPNKIEPVKEVFYKPVKSQHKRLPNLEIYSYLNKLVKKYHIDLVETKITQNNMKIDICGEFDAIISFLKKLEQNYIIDSYEMEQILDNTIAFSLSVNIEKFYEDKNMKRNDIKAINPYVLTESISNNTKKSRVNRVTESSKNNDIIITAIIKSEILISNEWYIVGDMYGKFKVKEIRKKSVVFLDTTTNKETIRRITNE